MKRTMILTCVALLAGCGERQDEDRPMTDESVATNATSVAVASVKRGLDAIVQFYETETNGSPTCDMNGLAQIRSLPDLDDQRACWRYFVDRLQSIRLAHLSFQRQAKVFPYICRDFDELSIWNIHEGERELWINTYDVAMKSLAWQKKQIDRVRPKRRLSRDEPYDPVREAELDGWRSVYYGGIRNYEAQLRELEGIFYGNRRRIGDDLWFEIKAKIEKFLGRPIRTLSQVQRDHRARRPVVFTDVKEDKYAAP